LASNANIVVTSNEVRTMLKTRRGQLIGTAAPARDYLTRHELLAIVPFGMTSVDALEKRGIFPKRFRLEPLRRVAWPRREVEAFLRARAKRRRGAACEDHQTSTGTENASADEPP